MTARAAKRRGLIYRDPVQRAGALDEFGELAQVLDVDVIERRRRRERGQFGAHPQRLATAKILSHGLRPSYVSMRSTMSFWPSAMTFLL